MEQNLFKSAVQFPHCLPNGNYDTLQCVNQACFCVNSESKNWTSAPVPITALTELPCCITHYLLNWILEATLYSITLFPFIKQIKQKFTAQTIFVLANWKCWELKLSSAVTAVTMLPYLELRNSNAHLMATTRLFSKPKPRTVPFLIIWAI